jgi:hypothetical protein
MFVDRQAELAFLNDVLTRNRPTMAQFILDSVTNYSQIQAEL